MTAPVEGCHTDDMVVRVNVFGRDIWYDIEQHRVLRWEEEQNGVLLMADMQQVTVPDSADGCSSCGCGGVKVPGRTAQPERTAAETQTYAAPAVIIDDDPTAERITAIELHLNDICNFRCTYCYLTEAGIEYHQNEMPEEVARKAVRFLVDGLGPSDRGLIRFFGGEPMMSYGLLQAVVLYAEELAAGRGTTVAFMMNTNGSLLTDDKIAWLIAHNVKVTFSIDGKEESHNRVRKYATGNKTFGAVAKKARRFFDQSGYLRIRSTISDSAFDIPASVKDLSDLAGAPGAVKLQFQAAYVGKQKIGADDVETINAEHSQLAQEWLVKLRRGEVIKYGNFVEPMFTMMNSIKTSYRCGAARSMVGVSPQGDLYPCHRFIEVKEVKMGTLDTGVDEAVRKDFRDNRVERKEPCRSCWVRFFCGGGCAHNNFFSTGNIKDGNNVYCQIFRHEVKLGLYLYTELMRSKVEVKRLPLATAAQ